jgi:hypothetical protein
MQSPVVPARQRGADAVLDLGNGKGSQRYIVHRLVGEPTSGLGRRSSLSASVSRIASIGRPRLEVPRPQR